MLARETSSHDAHLVLGGRWAHVVLAAALLATVGCQSEYRAYSRKLTVQLESGQYADATAYAKERIATLRDDDRDLVIYLLEAGRTAQLSGDTESSIRWYAEVHDRLRPYLDTEAEASASEGVATTLVNQAVSEYKGTPSDRMLAAALNSVNLLAMGRFDDARVELNRAADWQQDAVNRFQKEIDEQLAAAQKQDEKKEGDAKNGKEEKGGEGVTVSKETLDAQLKGEAFQNIESLTVYANFANPFIDHLRGVFYLSTGADPGDLDTARFAFRQVLAMEPGSEPMVAPDLEATDSASRRKPDPTTWVYFMNGLGPRLEEIRIDVPIVVGPVPYVAAAFPTMKFNDNCAIGLTVSTLGSEPVAAVPLADMDRIVGAEFRARLPLIITQEILSAAVKAAATYGLQAGLGDWGMIAGVIYTAASTSADTRTWRSIPKNIMVCRIPTPSDGVISISTDRPLGEVQVQPGVSNIVCVSLPAATTPQASTISIPLSRSHRVASLEAR